MASTETAEDRALKLVEWRKKHGKAKADEGKTPAAKSGRYKSKLRPRASRSVQPKQQPKPTPRKRGRNENVCHFLYASHACKEYRLTT